MTAMDFAKALYISTDKTSGVYTDDLMRLTGKTREYVTRELKNRGFVKSAGCTSRRWVKDAGTD